MKKEEKIGFRYCKNNKLEKSNSYLK